MPVAHTDVTTGIFFLQIPQLWYAPKSELAQSSQPYNHQMLHTLKIHNRK
jgi:hypothetical protein